MLEEPQPFYPDSRQAWREWLQANHQTEQSVWVLYYKKKTKVPSLTWSEAVDEALCFGWIDSTAKPIDEQTYRQFFSKRKPNSVWSKVNKEKVKNLIEQGLMMQAGLDSIAVAQQNGSWTILDEVEELIVPSDLDAALEAQTGAKAFFMGLTKNTRKAMLQWLVLAKQVTTRQKRISEIADLAAQGLKPKQF
jgi:uncharacterized protein YdeI (YjbR/CyaY-like superfamily)